MQERPSQVTHLRSGFYLGWLNSPFPEHPNSVCTQQQAGCDIAMVKDNSCQCYTRTPVFSCAGLSSDIVKAPERIY